MNWNQDLVKKVKNSVYSLFPSLDHTFWKWVFHIYLHSYIFVFLVIVLHIKSWNGCVFYKSCTHKCTHHFFWHLGAVSVYINSLQQMFVYIENFILGVAGIKMMLHRYHFTLICIIYIYAQLAGLELQANVKPLGTVLTTSYQIIMSGHRRWLEGLSPKMVSIT